MGLDREARALEAFKESGSPHIVKMYRRLYCEQGNGSMRLDIGLVHRMFLEYCPGGDLEHSVRGKFLWDMALTELQMWNIFHCLAKGALVMYTGSEDTSRPKWRRNIVHFDIKPQNRAPTADEEHRGTPVYKFADFGLSEDVPPVQDTSYQEKYAFCGTRPWYAPEQRKMYLKRSTLERPWFKGEENLLNSFDYGCHTNIWQVGLIMWGLKHQRVDGPDWHKDHSTEYLDIYQSKLSHRLIMGGLTVGSKKDIKEETDPSVAKYSISLRALINECLLIQTASRPSPEILVARTRRGLERARENASVLPYVPPAHAHMPPQNEPSSRWFSQDPFPAPENKTQQPQTLRLSELPRRIARARIEKVRDKEIEDRQRGWAARFNLKLAKTRLYQPGDSDPFAGIPGIADMRQNFIISSPLNKGADLAAGMAAGIGAGLGAGLGLVKDQVHAGLNAGAIRLADAIRPPPPEQNDDIWEVLSSHISPEAGSAGQKQAPDADALTPLPTLHCIVKDVGAFGALTHSIVKLDGLYKCTTIFQVKGALKAKGIAIPLHKMKVTVGTRTLEDHQTLTELGGRANVRVEQIH